MEQFALLLRGLWWRRGLAGATLLVAALTITAAALGPLYSRAAGESVLQDHLNQAGYTTGLHLTALINPASTAEFDKAATEVPKPGALEGYGSQIQGVFTQPQATAIMANGPGVTITRLVWREGACGHFVVVAGRCPTAPGEAMASQRTVNAGSLYNWKIGTELNVHPHTSTAYPDTTLPVRIVGVYRPIDTEDPFWFGEGGTYFNAHAANDGPDTVDALFVAKAELVGAGHALLAEADFDYPLTSSAVRLSDVGAVKSSVQNVLNAHPKTAPVVASTSLFAVLKSAARDRSLLNTATLLVSLQLALLAWLVFFEVVSDAAEARGTEIAITKLRGHSPAATVLFGLGEPIALLVAALPLGVAAAIGITHVFAHTVLVPGVPVVMPAETVSMSAVAFAGGLVAAVATAWRTFTRPVLEQWRRTVHRHRASRALRILDALLAAVAIIGVVMIRQRHQTGSGSSSVTLLAPGLLVFAVAILGVRGLPWLCRWLAHQTRATRWVGAFLATRQVGRRPIALRLASLLAVAIGLAVFAVAAESMATTNRTARAAAELGAYRVASVLVDPGLNPVSAVQQADPRGSWAMAAATWLPDGGQSVTGTVLAVDPSRLSTVAPTVPGGVDTARLASVIGGDVPPSITFKSTALRVELDVQQLQGAHLPHVQVDLRTSREPYLYASGSPLQVGVHSYLVPLPCAAGCQLAGLTWRPPLDVWGAQSGEVTLRSMEIQTSNGWHPVDLALTTPGSWRAALPEGHASDDVQISATGVTDRFSSSDGGYGGIIYADPTSIPVVAAAHGVITGSGAPGQLSMVDAFNVAARFNVAATTKVLPAVLDNGLAVNLRFIMDELPAFLTEAHWQVWLSRDAPHDAIARLDAAGLHVESVKSRPARVKQLTRQGPALALLLLLACALAGAVLAMGGTATSISASSKQRSYEVAALRAVRVRDRSLLAAAILEQLLFLGAALVLGVPAGLVAARLAMPVIPEFSDRTPITLHFVPQWLPTLGFAAALAALLALTSLVAGWSVMRLARPSRLREAE